MLPGLITFFLLCLVGNVIDFVTSRHRDRLQFLLRLFLIAFAIRFALSIAIYQFGLISGVGDEAAGGWRVGAGFHWNRPMAEPDQSGCQLP